MKIVNSVIQLRSQIKQWRQQGLSIAFVPTMGNLHQGHLHLVSTAKLQADRVVVSIFVNPTQFGEGEDFGSYPRSESEDCQQLSRVNADCVFLPSVEEIYGDNAKTVVSVADISAHLCGASRLGHFDGVATVVCKLFNMVQADKAFFGEKDCQQLAVIRQMVADLAIPVEVIGVETVREADGLAMSSRNGYLTELQRHTAPQLYQSLNAARQQLLSGETDITAITSAQCQFLQQLGFQPDYFEVCDTKNLTPIKIRDNLQQPLVILVAAQLGKARLIDNIRV